MAIGNINNGELGSSVRNKLNQLVDAINNQVVKLTGNQTISGEKYYTDNVGIGTTSPSEKLTIVGLDSNGGSGISLKTEDTTSTFRNINILPATGNTKADTLEGSSIYTTDPNLSSSSVFPFNTFGSTVFQARNDISSGFAFRIGDGSGYDIAMSIRNDGNVGIGTPSPSDKLQINGSFSATSKNFKIDHPLPAKKDTHKLVHASIEAPRTDLIYSGMVQLVDGTATVNIDTASNMTEGTFEALVDNVRRFCTNEGGFTRVKSSIVGNLLTVVAEDPACTDEIFWQVIGERKDAQIVEGNSTDENGNLIVEPEIIVEDE